MTKTRCFQTACFFVLSQVVAQAFETVTPESQGIRSDGLRQMSEWVRGDELDIRSMIVLRNGKMVFEWHAGGVSSEMNHNVFSVTKSVVSTLAGIAMDEKEIRGIDATLGDSLNVEGEKAKITLAQFLTMQSGFPQSRANKATGPERELFDRIGASPDRTAEIIKLELASIPGTKFAYSNIDPQLVASIVESEYGERIIDVARGKLFGPLGFKGARWVYADKTGAVPGGYGLRLRPVDMATLGQLYLQGGIWNGNQILPTEWVLEAVSDRTGSNYGYCWWTDAVDGYGKSFAAKGVRGQQILVVPEKEIVFVVTADLPPDRVREVLKKLNENFLLPAAESDQPLPDNRVAQSALGEELATAARYRPPHREGLPSARLPRLPGDGPSPSPASVLQAKFVQIAAHRGGYSNDRKDKAPENSVANVEVAIRKGFDVYETDIRRTADGHFVIVHDATLDRETDGAGQVENLSLAGMQKLRKRYRDGSLSDESVATLEELLTAGKDRILFKPDLKPGVIEHFADLAKLIAELEMEDQVFLRTSWKDAGVIAEHFAEGIPKVEVMFKVDRPDQVREVAERFSPATIQINFGKDEILSEKKMEAIRLAGELGMLVETHSYGDEAQWEDLAKAGVRMFHTAVPEETLEWLEENGWRE